MAIFDGHLARKTRGLGVEDSVVYRQPRKQKGAILIALQAVYCGPIVNPNRMFCRLNGHRKVPSGEGWQPRASELPRAEQVVFAKCNRLEVGPF